MRLKTKLALAITALVFLIAGLVSLVYVGQLLDTAVQQTYDTDQMVAKQIWSALQKALETGLKGQHSRPHDPAQLRDLVLETVRSDATLRDVITSVNTILPHRLRPRHRRQPVHHPAQHQPRQPGQTAPRPARLRTAPSRPFPRAHAPGLRPSPRL